ncbi:MAG TPA: hypothetical protein VJQ61_16055 [Sinomonas sp.]|nr:hypothetical protein [Sinomonas sp.]
MYRALWRFLPGPAVVRILVLFLLFVGILGALDQWVFPWVVATFVDNQGTVGLGS